jgi:hypothetical protein
MRFEIVQTSRTRTTALFQILSAPGRFEIGKATVLKSGRTAEIRFYDEPVKVSLEKMSETEDPVCAYRISRTGYSGTAMRKVGQAQGERYYTYEQLRFGELSYEMYPIGLGDYGIVYPVYRGEKQAALVTRPPWVDDGMYQFTVYVADGTDPVVPILLAMHLFVADFFRPLAALPPGRTNICAITRDLELLAKYDPEFEKQWG